MILSAFTFFHVMLSLIGIATGLVVLYGMLSSKEFGRWQSTFLATTAATTMTGFMFPVDRLLPSHVIGFVSTLVLAVAILARYRFGLAGGWRRTYVITAMTALYLNVFVLIVQLFLKVPSLKALAPTQSEPPFQIVQLVTLLLFTTLTIWAAMKQQAASLRTA